MPFVHVIMEPRDDESKHRIGREIADAMAEGTNNPLDGIQIIFHEVPRPGYVRGLSHASRRPRRPNGQVPVRAEYVSMVRLKLGDEDAYVKFRGAHMNPALAGQDGFVSTLLLHLDSSDEYLLLNKWISKAHADAWIASDEHKELERRAAAEVGGVQRLERDGARLVHQVFGAEGGKVIDPVAAGRT